MMIEMLDFVSFPMHVLFEMTNVLYNDDVKVQHALVHTLNGNLAAFGLDTVAEGELVSMNFTDLL